MKFTTVIPTRDGAETLAETLRACLDQQYSDYEVLVSDNASTDRTRDIVMSFDDRRIRYVNTGRRVSMTANWNFALQHVTDGCVTVLGDDDGLLPGAVEEAAALMAELKTPVLTWKKAQYTWPSWGDELLRNHLIVPVTNRLIRCDARQVVRDCARLWLPYFQGPCIYDSFVDTAVLRRIAERCGEPILYANTPDCYSTFAIASQLDAFWFSTFPFSLNGGSSHSNGGGSAALIGDPWRADASGALKFMAEIDIPPHPQLAARFVGTVVGVVVETALYANDRCFGGTLPVDVPASVGKIIKEARYGSPQRYNAVVQQLSEAAELRPELRGPLNRATRRYPNLYRPPQPPARGVSADDDMTLRAAEFGVRDVYGAAQLVRKLLGPYRKPAATGEYNHYFKYVRRGIQRLTPLVERNIW